MPFTWRDEVEVVCGDVTRAQDVAAALTGEAVRAGVRRIVYLGGITPRGQQLSRHLASRAEVGRILLAGSVPAIALQAAVIIGSGSASFEVLRYLTERLPVMVTPRWVRNRIQPIAVRDVLYYLTRAAELPGDVVGTFDIGGPDVLSYTRMMHGDAAVAVLPPRVIIPVPVLTPWLSAQWVNLVTPVPKAIAVPLMESLVNDVVCADHAIAQHIPDPPDGPIGYRRAVEPALAKIRNLDVPTRWSDADQFGTEPSAPLLTDPEWSGGSLYTDRRERRSSADPARLWAVIEAIGGDHGWYSFPLAWSLRGWIDRLTGGWGFAAAAGIRIGCAPGRRWIGGVSSASNARACCCARRCACPAAPGWNCAWTRTRAGPYTASARCSSRAGLRDTCIGRRFRRSTRSCSEA